MEEPEIRNPNGHSRVKITQGSRIHEKQASIYIRRTNRQIQTQNPGSRPRTEVFNIDELKKEKKHRISRDMQRKEV